MDKRIYLDNAATTPLLPQVRAKIIETLGCYGNPSSLYSLGKESWHLVEEAKGNVARLLSCRPDQVYFTSGASESNSWAVRAAVTGTEHESNIVATNVEHHSIVNTLQFLEDYYATDVKRVPVDSYGMIDADDVGQAIDDKTKMVTVMTANNEIGSINPIKMIAHAVHQHPVLFHTDATQALGKIEMREIIPCVDFASFSAHKIGGPKGIGALYVKDSSFITPLIYGTQQNELRGGTENLLGIIGFGEAARVVYENFTEWNAYVDRLAHHLRDRILNEIPGSHLNGISYPRINNNVNIRFDGIRGEELMMLLDTYGICVSTGSACNSSSGEPSYVLKAIGLTDSKANSSIRFSLSHENTSEEIDHVVNVLKDVLPMLRRK